MSYRTDKLFCVRVNGAIVAADITRKAAQQYLDNRQRGEFVQVYLAEKPIEGRPKPRLTPPIPRLPSMKVSAKEREKLLAKLAADDEIQIEELET